MIISHKYKFIFIKPNKVGGTSVQANLVEQCGEEDVFTKIADYSSYKDHDYYDIESQNAEGFQGHATPSEIKKGIAKDIWDTYTKITIVRNPWDLAVSSYYWEKAIREERRKKKRGIKALLKPSKLLRILKRFEKKESDEFERFVLSFPAEHLNTPFYLDSKGKPIADLYIRYENLEEDYKKLCNQLGIPHKKLPRLKTKTRKDKSHYSRFYNEKTKKIVEDMFKNQIEYFGYCFEEK